MSIRVVARIPAQPDKVDELKSLLAGLLEPTRKESGCIVYELLQNADDPADFTFVEEWESAAHLDAHLKTEHLAGFFSRVPDLVRGEPDVRTYNLVG